MTNAKHTPGPWHTDGWENIVVNDQWGTTLLCCPGSSTGTLPEIKANAALIAAAPAMYEEVRAAFELLIDLRDLSVMPPAYQAIIQKRIDAMSQAIAQAEGK